MRRFSCTVQLTLNFKDDSIEEDDIEEAITVALKRLHPTEVSVDDIEELDADDEKDLNTDSEDPFIEGDEDEDDDLLDDQD